MKGDKKKYKPRYPWSKRKYDFLYKLKMQKNNILKNLCPIISNKSVDAEKKFISDTEEKSISSISKDIELNLESIFYFWAIPIEQIENLKNGLEILINKHDTLNEVIVQKNFDSIFNYFDSFLNSDEYYELGKINFKKELMYIDSIEILLNNFLSSYIILEVKVTLSEECIKEFDKLINSEYENRVEPSFLLKNWDCSYTLVGGSLIRYSDIKDLLLDIKWEANEIITKYCSKKTFENIDDPYSIEIFTFECDNPNDIFWRSVNIPFGTNSDFKSEDELYHLFYSNLYNKSENFDLRILVDKKRKQEDVSFQNKILPKIHKWGNEIYHLIIVDSMLNDLDYNLSKSSKEILSNIPNENYSIFSPNELLKKNQKNLNLIGVDVNRLLEDYNYNKNQQKINNESAKFLNNNNRNLFLLVNNIISNKLNKVSRTYKLLHELNKKEIERNFTITNRKIQLFTLLIAIIALFDNRISKWSLKFYNWIVSLFH
ncbi:hypothetical protein [Halanaerobaculum tunisiense]